MEKIDLHVHSACSDGTLSPARLAELAREKGLRAFALTDHDTTAGLADALAAAESTGIEVIPGIEFSTEYLGRDVHIVGLDIDFKEECLQKQIRLFRQSRDIRNQEMIRKLQKAGMDISEEQMQAAFGDVVWTRAHFARYLMERGVVSNIPDAFRLYLGEGASCYVPREHASPYQAVSAIYQNGGIPVFAHPMLSRFSMEELHELIRSLKERGLIGMEVLYSTYSPEQERLARKIAKEHGLAISGGSDFHGANKPDIELGSGRGNLMIPYEVLQNLRNRRHKNEL